MGYAQRASNGERPQHITDRRFRFDAAVAITNQATVLEQLLASRESQQQLVTRLAGDYLKLRNDVTFLAADYAITSSILKRPSIWGRFWWLLTGR